MHLCSRSTDRLSSFSANLILGGYNADSLADEDWELPTPKYVFSEWARLMKRFYGPVAENLYEDKLLDASRLLRT